MASIADALIRKGHAKGYAKSFAESHFETLLLLVRQKFKHLPKRREAQVQSASLEQLKDWLSRILDAPDLETLFEGSGNRSMDKLQLQG